MSKRRPTVLGTHRKNVSSELESGEVIYGNDVEVLVLGEENPDPNPAFPFDFEYVYANIGTMSTEEVRDYQAKLQAWRDGIDLNVFPKFDADLDFIGSDEFFGTVEENAVAASKQYLSDIDETFKPLTEMLGELGID